MEFQKSKVKKLFKRTIGNMFVFVLLRIGAVAKI